MNVTVSNVVDMETKFVLGQSKNMVPHAQDVEYGAYIFGRRVEVSLYERVQGLGCLKFVSQCEFKVLL